MTRLWGRWPRNSGLIHSRVRRLLRNTQTGFGAYIDYLLVNGDFLLVPKEAKVWNRPLSPSAEVAYAWSYTFFASWQTQEQLYYSNTVIPDLHHLDLRSTLKWSQAFIFRHSVLKFSLSCWTTIVRISHSNILMKFRSKALLKKLVEYEPKPKERTMTVLKVTEAPGHKVGIKVSENIDSNKQQAVTTSQGFMRMLACLLWWNSEGEEEVFISHGNIAWFPQVIFRDSCITSCIVEHWRWWYQWPIYSSRGSTSFLNCDFFLFLCFLSMNIFDLGHNKLSGITLSILTMCYGKNLSQLK